MQQSYAYAILFMSMYVQVVPSTITYDVALQPKKACLSIHSLQLAKQTGCAV